ncbi:hypothetical protein E7811_06835 [Aliigemmobacter aestuarii]|uniref:OmpA-like domain-containing protein n=1 Tax=Aliigemmobacter aestuarii TaxID=1445661 RepID=A0A4S3MS68_9RHOB|nr:phosphate ABC transporter substrate-binding/OmpA family protein [Gemmobacter aestuarii]THD85406.1 hypothetical protein E7811_06835 [Gemmobacter aestuarii]
MRIWHLCAAIFAALFVPLMAAAQDVSLTSRDGALTLDGTLMGFDGEFYRIETRYGLLTVDAQGVICTGPGCPDLTAPLAVIRIVGDQGAGRALVPSLFRAFAAERGLEVAETAEAGGFRLELTEPAEGRTLARISFAPLSPDRARAELMAARAELILSPHPEPGLGERTIALDALVPVVATDNPLPAIATADLARVLAGDVTNWAELGGPDMPVVVHALDQAAAFQQALDTRLGRPVRAEVRHGDTATLAQAVARDPYGVAMIGRAEAAEARVLPLTDSCGFPLLPDALSVKAEDYPLALPIRFLTPRRRLPLMAREFLDFLSMPAAQAAIAAAGYVDRAPERRPMTADGLRLINAVRGVGEDVALADLKALVEMMAGADRLSLTFRFTDGSSTLDGPSRDNLADLARMLEAGLFTGEDMLLVGFSDGSGDARANRDLSRARADAVLQALSGLVEDLPEGQEMPRVAAFGETSPMACDTTAGGRRINRRVEVWLRPHGG